MATELTSSDIYTGTTDPTTNVNPKKIGSLWVNSATGDIWVCNSNMTNKNKWIKVAEDLKDWVQETIIKITSNSIMLSNYKGTIYKKTLYDLIKESGYGNKIPTEDNHIANGWIRFNGCKFKTPDIPYYIKEINKTGIVYNGDNIPPLIQKYQSGDSGSRNPWLYIRELPNGENDTPVNFVTISEYYLLPNTWYYINKIGNSSEAFLPNIRITYALQNFYFVV